MIEMTVDQRRAIQGGEPVRLCDPDLGGDVVVCPLSLFEDMERQLREFTEDEKEQAAWVATTSRCLAKRLEEDDDQPG